MHFKKPRFNIAYVVGIFIAPIVFYFWNYANIEIWGYWSFWRFNEHWPKYAQLSIPVIFFAVAIVFPTFYLLARAQRDLAAAAILSYAILFSLVEVYTYTEMGVSELPWVTLAARTIVVILGASIALMLLSRRKNEV